MGDVSITGFPPSLYDSPRSKIPLWCGVKPSLSFYILPPTLLSNPLSFPKQLHPPFLPFYWNRMVCLPSDDSLAWVLVLYLKVNRDKCFYTIYRLVFCMHCHFSLNWIVKMYSHPLLWFILNINIYY